jgi:hypothetical protein
MKYIVLFILLITQVNANDYTPPCQDRVSTTGWRTPCVCWGLDLPKNTNIVKSSDNPCVYKFKQTVKSKPIQKEKTKPVGNKHIYF